MNNNDKDQQESALIIGSAYGIGYQLAYIFSHHNYNMVLVDKHQEKLAVIGEEFISKFGFYVKTLVDNLSISTSPESIFKDLQQAAIRIDILANNGGFGTYGVFTNTDSLQN
jgi:short-subunit dehydrogenase